MFTVLSPAVPEMCTRHWIAVMSGDNADLSARGVLGERLFGSAASSEAD